MMATNQNNPNSKPCKDCGVTIERKRGRQFCTTCAKRKMRARVDVRRLSMGVRFIGMPLVCQRCELEVVSTGRRQKYCAPCSEASMKERFKRYQDRHPEKRAETYRKHNARRQATDKYQEWQRTYKREVSTPVLAKKRREDPKTNLDHRMSQLVRSGLANGKGGRTWRSLVPYSIEELMRHLERQFLKGMTWGNMGDWHVDHIVPKSSFKFTTPDDGEFRACWALTNLRPLWALDNIKKNNKTIFLV